LYSAVTGAPDPTAGGALDDDNSWHLDEEQVQKLVKNYLSQGIYCNHNEHLSSIFDKVKFVRSALVSTVNEIMLSLTVRTCRNSCCSVAAYEF